jgi:hypothetical protein
MKQEQSFEEKRSEYYFTHLANMAFMAIKDTKTPKTFLVDKVNEKTNDRMGKVRPNQPLQKFLQSIILEEEVVREYLEIVKGLPDKSVLSSNRSVNQWRYFYVSLIHENEPEEGIFIKSILPYGIKTGLRLFNGYKEAIYIDLFTATQIIDGEFIGLQGMMPIVNERREATLVNQKSLELTLFHHLKVDMQKIPEMVQNVLDYDKSLSNIASKGLNSIREYSTTLTKQANEILSLFHKYVTIEGSFPPTPVADLKQVSNTLQEKFGSDVSIECEFEPELNFFSTTLFPEVFEFTARQFIGNAIKEYTLKRIPIPKRKIKIKAVKIGTASQMRISFYNSATSLTQSIIDNAGIRPVPSSSSGLGFYFLNYALEMFRAIKPDSIIPRYFQLENVPGKEKGVNMNIYFPINP